LDEPPRSSPASATRSILAAALLWLPLSFAATAPADAGTVYLALAANTTVGGITYESVLQVTNTGTAPHFFVPHFIESFSDGTARAGANDGLIGVPAGHTYVYDNLGLPPGKTGMLEIHGDDELVFSAHLVPRIGSTRGPDSALPVVGSEELVAGGRKNVVQGFRRDSENISSLVLINFEHQSNQCTVDLLSAIGQKLMSSVVLTLKPLSQSVYHDVLAIAGLTGAADTRFEIRCAGRSFAFGERINLLDASLTTLQPAPSLLSSLRPPGDVSPGGGGGAGSGGGPCPSTSLCINLPGTFHVATNANKVYQLKIPAAQGTTFNRVDVEVTFTHGGWYKPLPDGSHNVFWLFSDARFADVTWFIANVRGPGRDFAMLVHTINQGRGFRRRVDKPLTLIPGQSYKVHCAYDTGAGFVECSWSTADGQLLAEMSDISTADRVFFEGPEGWEIWFGIYGEGVEVPSIGWEYRDARIEFSN
jgi:hypothetical protein